MKEEEKRYKQTIKNKRKKEERLTSDSTTNREKVRRESRENK